MVVSRIKYSIIPILFHVITSCNNHNNTFLGAVTSATPEASTAGEEIFLKDGNAIDVAIAISFALAVTEPAMSGLGGGTQVLLSLKNQQPIAINGTTLSPYKTPISIKDTLTYHRRSTIPSTVKVLDYLWKNYGSGNVSWEDLLKPSIELAENGFVLGEYRAKVYHEYGEKLKSSQFSVSSFLIDNRIPQKGDTIKQPELAKTLKRLAEFRAEDFYNGEIAKKIALDMQEHGGWITIDDLNNFPAPKELKPLSVEHRGMMVYSQPPPCGGWITLLALNLMEKLNKDAVLTNEEVIKALYIAHNERNKKPVNNLTTYDSILKNKLSKSYSKKLLLNEQSPSETIVNKKTGETTHFSVVDSEGNSIAVTSSINAYFGALAASKDLGFLYNTYMDDFIFEDPDHPFAIRPNAMAYSSMSPSIVQENGKTVLVLGSPGSSRIISAVSQITAKWIEGRDIQHAVTQPRIHVSNNTVYHENKEDTLSLSKEFLTEFDLLLKTPSESLMLQEKLNAYYGGVHAIAKENGNWIGIADPRRDGKSIIVKKSNSNE